MKRLGYLIAAMLILVVPRVSVAVQVQVVPLEASDLVFNTSDGRLYASVPATVPVYGNTVTAIDPATGALGPSVFVGSEPGKLALSDDGRTLYVALQGAAAVRVVDLSTMIAGLQFNLGSDPFFGPYYPEDMAVQPGHPNVVAVSLMYLGVSPRHAGVAIFDNGVPRPLKTQTHTGSNRIEFSSDPSRIYGYNNETTEFGFRRLLVTEEGVTEVDVSASLIAGFSLDILYDRGRVYATSGRVVDPEAYAILGTFPLPDFGQAMAADSDRAYYLTGGSFYGPTMLHEFDSALFTPVLSQPVPGASGTPRSLVRWGTDGLAFRTENQVLLLTHIHEPPTCDLELTQSDSGDPVTQGSTFSYNVEVRNLSGSIATEVVARDLYPVATYLESASSSRGFCSDSSGTVVCQLGSMAPGDSAVVTLYLYASTPGTLENAAWVTSATLDTNPGNNASTETTVVNRLESADMNVRQSHSPSTGSVGGTLSFTVNVGNAGPDSARSANLYQQIYGVPVTLVSAIPTKGTCSGDSGSVVCALGTLAAGESAQVVVTLIPNAAGFLASYLSVGSAAQDPNFGDNSSFDNVEVRVSAGTLITNLITLVQSYQLRRGLDRILVEELTSVQAALGAEDTSAACASLGDFRLRVGRMAARQLTLAQATQLDTDAGDIASLLQCGGAALAASRAVSQGAESGKFSFRTITRPGNGAQRFALYLPVSAHARLEVFDVSGRLVRVAHDGELPAGSNELTWDGRNTSGVRASVGVYFLRLSAGRNEAVVRSIMLR